MVETGFRGLTPPAKQYGPFGAEMNEWPFGAERNEWPFGAERNEWPFGAEMNEDA